MQIAKLNTLIHCDARSPFVCLEHSGRQDYAGCLTEHAVKEMSMQLGSTA